MGGTPLRFFRSRTGTGCPDPRKGRASYGHSRPAPAAPALHSAYRALSLRRQKFVGLYCPPARTAHAASLLRLLLHRISRESAGVPLRLAVRGHSMVLQGLPFSLLEAVPARSRVGWR